MAQQNEGEENDLEAEGTSKTLCRYCCCFCAVWNRGGFVSPLVNLDGLLFRGAVGCMYDKRLASRDGVSSG